MSVPVRTSVWVCAALSIFACSFTTATQYGKNSIAFPSEPFAVQSTNSDSGWIKFLILTGSPGTVWFQDTNHYPFHYDFAHSEFLQFSTMTPEEFDDVTLYEPGQQAILGAVILPPLVGYNPVIPEYGIQLVRRDPYDPVVVRDLFNLVRSAIVADPGVQALYFPSFEQQPSAEQNRAWFASQGIEISSTGRWADGNACYSEGWALGELKYVEAAQIDAAYVAGTLGPSDILLTDAVPAEIPYLAGVLCLSPSTPSSHVAILANTFGVPFAHLALSADAQRAQDLLGHRVAARVEKEWEGCQVRLIDVEGVLDPATIDEILALKDPPALSITPVEALGSISASTDGLQLTDIRYFGGKAANFGTLRRALPATSPIAVAFSFDLWTSFMDQQVTGGITLRQEIATRLSPYSYPPEMSALSASLSSIRDLIKDTGQTAFTPASMAGVLAALQDPQYGFDPNSKLRFRSSTNVEDSDQFTGAGLYDSFSGCLADDLDGNSLGPSLCDPLEPDERGVFRAIRKVFASFYNLNAFVERLRHGIDENQVGMALLSHHSFLDADELANGVATLRRFSATNRDAYLVSQAGASSVTNPEPGAVAEEVDVWVASDGTAYPVFLQASNLVQLGATVMEFPGDYEDLTQLLLGVGELYATESGLGSFTLEFEYKKLAVGQPLRIKQVRRIPANDDTPSITPFLIDEPTEYCTYQGESGDVFANHRLKSRWSVQTESLWLTPANLQNGFFADVTMDYTEVCQQYTQSGPLPQWPGATHAYSAGTADEGWSFASLQNPRDESLRTEGIPELVAPSQSPLLTLRDLGVTAFNVDGHCMTLQATYARAVPSRDYTGPILTDTETALVCPCLVEDLGDRLQQRSLAGGDGTTVSTSFLWPAEAEGVVAGYTAPAIRFVETVIDGLTSTPIVLQGEYSQTYRPEHHNFGENFLFEPALEPGIPQQQLDELTTAGVRAIHVVHNFSTVTLTYYDDNTWGDPCLDCTGFDGDRDGWCTESPAVDCDDQNPEVWSPPGEARSLLLPDKQTLAWSAPIAGGGSALYYDTLRAGDAGDLTVDAFCVETDDGSDLQSTDLGMPAEGEVFYYVVRAQNDCPAGEGSLGTNWLGVPRVAPSCP